MDTYRHLLIVLVTLTYVKHADGIRSVKMEDYCGAEISMIWLSEYQLKITFTDTDGTVWYNNRCPVDIEAWYTWPRLAFYFENFNLSCGDGSLQFYDGKEGTDNINGLHTVCGTKPTGVFTTDTRYLQIKYFPKNKKVKNNIFSIIVTSFVDEDECPSYGYKCSNGRCIDDDLQCNGYNSCGDNSGCRLSAGAIAGIVIGSVFVLTMILSISVAIYCCRRRKTAHSTGQVLSTPNANTTGQVLGSDQPRYNTNYVPNPAMNYVGAQTGNYLNTTPSIQVQEVPHTGTSPYPSTQTDEQLVKSSAPPAYEDVCN